MDQSTAIQDSYAVVEMLGHRVIAGRVQECKRFGIEGTLIDVAAAGDAPAWQTFVAGSSIYAVTPCSQAQAEHYARRNYQRAPEYLSIAAPAAAPALVVDDAGNVEDAEFLANVVGRLDWVLAKPGSGYIQFGAFRLELDQVSDAYVISDTTVSGNWTEIHRTAVLTEALDVLRAGFGGRDEDQDDDDQEDGDWEDDNDQDY